MLAIYANEKCWHLKQVKYMVTTRTKNGVKQLCSVLLINHIKWEFGARGCAWTANAKASSDDYVSLWNWFTMVLYGRRFWTRSLAFILYDLHTTHAVKGLGCLQHGFHKSECFFTLQNRLVPLFSLLKC